MARINTTIAGRMMGAVFFAHLIVLPLLCFALFYLVSQNSEAQFLDYVRGYTRYVAESLEQVKLDEADTKIDEILDSFRLSGTGVFAELRINAQIWRGSLGEKQQYQYIEDFHFGEHNDGVYFMSAPVEMPWDRAVLHLGFDERPVIEQNFTAYKHAAAILLTYLAVITAMVAWIGIRIMRPIRELQKSTRDVSSGAFKERLITDSKLVEFKELAKDLDQMRARLTNANTLLQKEINDREKAEKERADLQIQLNHRQRIETVGTLAGGIAHELNNVLVPILLYLDLAIDDLPNDSPVLTKLERAIFSANRARGIVGQVLAFSRRIETTELKAVDIRSVIIDSLKLIHPAIPPNILLNADVACDKAWINADPELMNQMVVNLFTNAYQAMQISGGELSVVLKNVTLENVLATVHTQLAPARYIQLTVADSGEGIEMEKIERIFEPFYSTRAIGSGTGLGLSLVHGVVTALQGGIVVQSTPGKGSKFEIYLPCMNANEHGETESIRKPDYGQYTLSG